MLSRFSRVRLYATLWTAAHQAPLYAGVSRQEYWSGLAFPSPCLTIESEKKYFLSDIMRNAGLEEAQAGIKIAGRNTITSDMQMTPPLWQKVKRNSKAS